jgi:DNA-binding NtrC family response regulator
MPRPSGEPVILLVDDDLPFLDSTSEFLNYAGYECLTAPTCARARQIGLSRKVDLAILDQNLPDGLGSGLGADLLAHQGGLKIIFMTACPTFEVARQAIRTGAFDYLAKPFEADALALAVDRALRMARLERLERAAEYRRRDESQRMTIIGAEGGLREVAAAALQAGGVDAPVLITGETGTGKGLVARYIHYEGRRRTGPFLALNCAAVPENLFEAELFGYEKDAFTGATSAREGLLETASGGTLLLDELGELPLHLQAKLLGALEDRKIRRLGGRVERPIDARIIAATNVDLEAAAARGAFRKDLYFRIHVLGIHVPPLRQRPQDLPELCRHLLAELDPHGGRRDLGPGELAALQAYAWPGNVRELRNVLERALLQAAPAGPLRPSGLLSGATSPVPDPVAVPPTVPTLAEAERDCISRALSESGGNQTRAARALGIALSTLKRKIKESSQPS